MNNDYSLMTFMLANSWGFSAMSYEDTVRLAHTCGLKYIDVIGGGDDMVEQHLAAMAKYLVKVKCYISYLQFLGDREEMVGAMDADLERARRLGAELFMIVPHQYRLDHERITANGPEWTINGMIEGFKIAVERAKPYGFKVGFETTPHDESMLSGMDDCKRVLDSVPGLGYIFDTANMLPHGDDPIEHYELLKDYIVHVHLKDVRLINAEDTPNGGVGSERTADGKVMRATMHGEGVIPIAELYRRLMADGYTGAFALEYVPPMDARSDFDANVAQVKRFIDYTGGINI